MDSNHNEYWCQITMLWLNKTVEVSWEIVSILNTLISHIDYFSINFDA